MGSGSEKAVALSFSWRSPYPYHSSCSGWNGVGLVAEAADGGVYDIGFFERVGLLIED